MNVAVTFALVADPLLPAGWFELHRPSPDVTLLAFLFPSSTPRFRVVLSMN